MLVTALWTPFRKGGAQIDRTRVAELVAFQLDQGAHQVLLGGTTGEGMALTDVERGALLEAALEAAKPAQLMLSIGGGRLDEIIARGRACVDRGVRDLLLVDCPYSGATSAALRESWFGPVAEALPDGRLLPYAVPSRSATELLPDDLALLAERHPNVVGVKDATGRLARMLRVRDLCGPDFRLLCGDDGHLRDAMLDPAIVADGVVSVAGNLAPAALRTLVDHCKAGQASQARDLHDALGQLFRLGCISTEERLVLGERALSVPQRARNPVPLKAALGELGMQGVAVRPPLAPLGPNGRRQVRNLVEAVVQRPGQLLEPLMSRFGLALVEAPGTLVSEA